MDCAIRGRGGRSRQRRVAGFTLIELLVVFTLLALLLGIAVPRYLGSVDSAKDKVRQQNMSTIRDALDKFKADQGRYPSDLGELVNRKYLRSVPMDPVSDSQAWTLLPPPPGEGDGVYDVAPPASAEAGKS